MRKHRLTKDDRLEPFRREVRAIFQSHAERYGYEEALRIWLKAAETHTPDTAMDVTSDEALERGRLMHPDLFTDSFIEAVKHAKRPLS